MLPQFIDKIFEASYMRSGTPNVHASIRLLCEAQNLMLGRNIIYRKSFNHFDGDKKEMFTKCSQWLSANGYTYSSEEPLFSIAAFVTDGEIINATINIENMLNSVRIFVRGSENLCNEAITWFDSEFKKEGYTLSTAVRINKNDAVEFQENYILSGAIQKPLQSFYPWLTIPLEEYFKAFMESDENILVLYGPAGTGKSSFTRYLLDYVGKNAYLAYNKDIVATPHLLEQFYRDDAQIIAYEDLDTQLDSRENGNTLMSSILNGAEGIIKTKKKMIFSVNLPSTSRIDSALLRVGRCFDILEFTHLTQEEATKVRSDLGKPLKDLSSKAKWSLAEATADTNEAQQVVNRFGRKVGF